MDAEIVVSALQGHGISAFVLDDNVCRIYPQAALLIGGAKVIVRFEELEDAMDVLGLAFEGEPPFSGAFLAAPLSLLAAVATMIKRPRKKQPPAFHAENS